MEEIHYYTERKDKLGFDPIEEKEILQRLDKLSDIDIDIEAPSLEPYDAYTKGFLLVAIGDKDNQIVIDGTTVDISFLSKIKGIKEKRFCGHNIKYDAKILFLYGFQMFKIYDTQIAEQTISMGLEFKHGHSNSLEATKKRRINKDYIISKDTRKEFIGADKNFDIKKHHVLYAAEDTVDLEAIREAQKLFIDKYNLGFVLYEIEFPLLLGLVETELTGVTLDIEAWTALIVRNKIKRDKLELELDTEIRELSSIYPRLNSRKYQNERKKQELEQTDLFGEGKIVVNKNIGNINYNSNQQVKQIFRDCLIPVPIKKEKGATKETTGIPALEDFILLEKDTPLKKFLTTYIEYSQVKEAISSFGQKFIDWINPVTGKLHTIYRQCGTTTGRFASGDKNAKLYNSQNIKKLKEYRTPFCKQEGRKVLTIDLSGAELVILASLSGDEYLKTILDDAHSPLATSCYNTIIDYIFEIFPEHRLLDELTELVKNEEVAKQVLKDKCITISSKTNKYLRTTFKNVIYGLNYGASEQKIAKTLNIPIEYAGIIVRTLKKRIPRALAFLNESSKFGVKNGYIILSERTNNRRWFPEILEAKRNGYQPSFGLVGDVERECKNSPIQGTQAAMVKESMVRLYEYLKSEKANKYNGKLLLQVHDELVFDFNDLSERENIQFAEDIKKILCDTCNLYMKNGILMGADYDIEDTWTKG